jgi:hypothetical protein
MTIAACYVSPEGVVLGADSTSTYGFGTSVHYYNFSQKLFEIGEGATLSMVCWGLGGLQITSHRTQIGVLSDDIARLAPSTVQHVAEMWADQFWAAYNDPANGIANELSLCRTLGAKTQHDPTVAPSAMMRTQDEELVFMQLQPMLTAGFCIAGHILPDRTPAAFEIIFDPLGTKPVPAQKSFGYWFWGAPNMIQRLIFGFDDGLKSSILSSGHWTGTLADLDALSAQHALAHPIIPIRDAIDFIYSFIFSTIKAFKFSTYSQICGGPIEVAVITTDRRFRWVKHKELDAAIAEGVR